MDLLGADLHADIEPVTDRGENVLQMGPMLIRTEAKGWLALADLALELSAKSTGFRRSLPSGLVDPLARLVRSMNCYYSNLIEGHLTHPIDIERALRQDYSHDPVQRNLQLEAEAHIGVQEWLDAGGLGGARPTTRAGICELHRRFYERLPDEMLWVEEPASPGHVRVSGGELRLRDVQVGRHVPVSPGAVPRFLDRFEEVYRDLGATESILATAAAHHRLLWIHPFLDGNGRVARLMSHAMLVNSLDTGALWSVARGLARQAATYKQLLANCDRTRRNDLDGRGNLSEEALAEFTRFFLQTCIDQVDFMEGLLQPAKLRQRILAWADEEAQEGRLPGKSGNVLAAVLYRGELERGDVDAVVGTGERQGRRIVSSLMERGVLTAEGPRSPWKMVFPAALASRWLPGLFPEL